jgi:hypothetical protein
MTCSNRSVCVAVENIPSLLMLMYQKDNGSFWGGFFVFALLLVALAVGFRVGQLGYVVEVKSPEVKPNVQVPPKSKEVR